MSNGSNVRTLPLDPDEFLQIITGTTSDAIITIDATSTILFANSAVERIFGYRADELLDKPLTLLMPDYLRKIHELAVERYLSTGKRHVDWTGVELAGLHRDGHEITLEITFGESTSKGRYVFTGIIRDISGRKVMEAALRENEAELGRANERLLHRAMHDSLTRLPNRVLLMDRLEQVLRRRLQDPERDAALLFLDFDRFKIVNDSLGHAVGDAMLVAIARILREVVRPEDTVARLGGDEFVILMDHVDAVKRSVDLANRIQAAFEKPIGVGSHLIYTSASIGIVPSMVGYDDAHAVLRDADTAMYGAKESGGDGHQVFDQTMRDRVVATMELETALRRAMAGNELRVGYGPIHRVDTGAVVGFEALVRWQHPQRGLLTADEFISVASEMGIVGQIDQRVWREANRTLAAWRDRFGRPLLLSLNFSRQHFLSPNPEKALLGILEETGAAPDQTVVELAAGSLSDVPEKVATSILKLVASGLSLHLDDFGTAQTSLVSLQGFHVSALKLDPSLVERMIDDEKCMELVRTIFAMADSLDVDVIAKGVDTEAQRARLLELGCAYAQGSLFSPTVDEEGAIQLLQAHDDDAKGVETGDA